MSGKTELLFDGERFLAGQQVDIDSSNSLLRLLKYYAWVGDNGIFYGVYKRQAALAATLGDVLGGDWYFVAGVAYLGKLRTIDTTTIHRSGDGASANLSYLAKALGHNRMVQCEPYIGVAYGAFKDLMRNDRIYGELNPILRFGLALSIMIGIFLKKVVLQKIFRILRAVYFSIKRKNPCCIARP